MSFILLIYRIYIQTGAIILAQCLYTINWKKSIIEKNLQVVSPVGFSRFRFYKNAAVDFLTFIHGKPLKKISLSSESQAIFHELKECGGLLLTGHFHNWELMGGWLIKNGLSLHCLAQPLNNRFWNKLLVFFRNKINLPVINENYYRFAINWIVKRGTFGILWDQHSRSSSLMSSFFEQPVIISKAPILIQNRTKCSCYFFYLDNNFTIHINKLEFSGSNGTMELSNKFHNGLETLIKEDPELWYSLAHRRFKNQKTFYS